MNLFDLAGNISINTQSAINALSSVQNAANRTSQVFSNIGNGVNSARNAFSGMQNATGGVSTMLSNVGTSLQNAGQAMGNFGQAVDNSVSRPIRDFFMQGLQFNSQIQDLTTSFDVMLGSAKKSAQMVTNLKKMGAATPFETGQLAEYTKKLLAMGYTEKEVIPIMSRMGDVSLGSSGAMLTVVDAMGKAKAMGKLQGGELNRLQDQGFTPLQIIMKKTGESMDEVRDRMAAGKISYKELEGALVTATDKGGRFYQGMAKGSQTLSGKISTLKDNFKDFLGKVTKPLFDYLSDKAVPALTDLIGKFANLDPSILKAVTAIGGFLIALGPAIIIGSKIVGVIGTVMTVMAGLNPVVLAIAGAITFLAGVFGSLILVSGSTKGVFKTLKNVFSVVKDVITGDFVGALGTLVDKFGMSKDAAIDFLKPFKKIQETASGVFKTLGKIPALLGAFATGDWTSVWVFLVKQLKLTGPEATKVVKDLKRIKPALDELGRLLAKISVKAITKLSSAAKDLASTMYKNRSRIAAFISILAGIGENTVKGTSFLIKMGKGIVNFVTGSIRNLKKFEQTVGTVVIFVLQSLLRLPETLLFIGREVNRSTKGILKYISTNFGKMVSSIGNFLGNAASSAGKGASKIVSNIGKWLSKVPGNIAKWFSGIAGNIGSALSSGASRASSGASKIVSNIGKWLSQVPGKVSGWFSGISGKIGSALSSAAKTALNWGSKIVSNLASGIKAGIGKVSSAISSVAGVIADHMPHSPAKTGPLKSADKFAPGFMKMLISGFKKGLPGLKTTVALVAETIREQFYNATTAVNGYFDKLRETVQQSLQTQKDEAVEEVDKMAENIQEALTRANPRMSEEDKLAETKRLLKSKNKDELKDLLKTYYPEWQDAGRSLGDILVNGLNSKKTSMSKALTGFFENFNDAVKATETKTMKWLNKLEKKYEAGIKKMKKSTGKIEDYEELIEKAKSKIQKGKLSKKEKKKNAELKEDIEHYKKHLESLEKYNKKLAKKFNMKYKGGEFFFPDGTQAFAKGVKNFKGGWAMVGEEGAELVHLPYGSSVIPNNKINSVNKNELGYDTPPIILNVNNPKFFTAADVDKFMKPVVQQLQRNINIKRTR